MKIAVASDHRGFLTKEKIVAHLSGTGHEPVDMGPASAETVGVLIAISRRYRSATVLSVFASTTPRRDSLRSAAAEMLRRRGFSGGIVMLSDDTAPPVDRPNLSKDYLAGTAQEDWLPLRPDEFYAEAHIDLRLGAKATALRPATREVVELVHKVARLSATVLIRGESGTGKELVARMIHRHSETPDGPFIPVNLAAMPRELVESTLFGHEKGAFTGALRQQIGKFELAHGGTLFLDEVTEMPIDLQVKLLRVLETGKVQRVGGSEPIKVDVRTIAASNRSAQQAVAEGKLREDLHYRLNVFPLQLPPLREREDDVLLLAEAFLDELNKQSGGEPKAFTRAALDRLKAHTWPGNVRELRNVVQRAFILAPNDIGVDSLPLGVVEERLGTTLAIRVGTPIDEAERRLILATLEHCAGDKKKAAEILKISLKTLYNRLNVYNA